MYANAVLENLFGTIGAILWSIQLIPQLWKSYRRKNTAGLSSAMLGIWFFAGIWLGAYVLIENLSIPLLIQPQLFCFFAAVAYAQCLYYDQNRTATFATTVCVVCCSLAGGLEAGLIFAARHLESRGNRRLTTAIGTISAIFIVLGLLPQYYEIYQYRAVIGISLIFITIDLVGGVMSTLSLVFAKGSFDTLAALSYAAVVVLEIGILALVPVLNPRYHRRQEERKRKEDEALSRGTIETTVCDTPNSLEKLV
ncbi:hypothetical protein MVLG_02271 [Microbotryum lychnidis-dioicae p1A1 Lamole]|uniref:PQ loop repeat protein n=1 Tax=Microbotryum lychnidis-dioicae (strain p1A1 Lamole / MvSl-1064) TaxID=683840 RepID=U5H4N3_USTV1|nr:hypothetical protein MVLG_02271 [Microbotryum lychnidis-dioicae p1A1 Lamole]|eukprot:KDE07404.1 hypothetical protein MVLG_02271 [Microbotryum lychnidis-dioicae p1A1 Lamole]